jgi:hypothetical protein
LLVDIVHVWNKASHTLFQTLAPNSNQQEKKPEKRKKEKNEIIIGVRQQ